MFVMNSEWWKTSLNVITRFACSYSIDSQSKFEYEFEDQGVFNLSMEPEIHTILHLKKRLLSNQTNRNIKRIKDYKVVKLI